MRLSSTQLRIGLLCANLALGLGIPGYAAYRYFASSKPDREKPAVAIVPVESFRDTGDKAGPAPTQGNELRFVGTLVQPKQPEVATPTPTDTTPTETPEEPPDGEEALKPGKLQEEGWYYAAYLMREDPLDTFVILRKKDPATLGQPGGTNQPGVVGSTRANPRVPIKPTGRPAPRAVQRVKGALPQALDEISFHVKDRCHIDEDKGLDFMIHSADEKQFVYWFYDDPKRTLYALKYEAPSEYMKQDTETHVTLKAMQEKPPEDPGAPKKKPGFIWRTRDFNAARELEYKELLAGEGLEPVETPTKGGLRRVKTKEGEEAPQDPNAKTGTTLKPGAGAAKPKPGPITPSKSKTPAAQPKDLKEALGTPELRGALDAMPADKKKELLDGLKGIKPASK